MALKQAKGGAAYAAGKTLIVFLEAGGEVHWFPNRVTRVLPTVDFDSVWVVGLQRAEQDGGYVYGVSLLSAEDGDAPTWTLRIKPDFETWQVERTQ